MTQGSNGPDGLEPELPPEQEARMLAALRSLGEPRVAGEIDDQAMLARVLSAMNAGAADEAPRATSAAPQRTLANDVPVVPPGAPQRTLANDVPVIPSVAPRARPTFRRGVAAAFAGLAIAATVAYAAQQLYVRSQSPAPPEAPAPSGAPQVRSVAPRPAPVPSETASSTTDDAPPATATATAPPEEPAPTASAPPAPPPTADDLLKRAQKLYTAGDMAGATAAYRALVTRYPGSGEAHAALISLGQLALAGGRAGEALADFDRYLAGSGGSLSTEARVGRIAALRALGRTSEERAAIEDFLARSGTGVHAARLRARLAEIAGP
jgi:hypothetical protein